MPVLTGIITSSDPAIRNQSLDAHCAGATREELLAASSELDAFRRDSTNLYERVRALFFLYAIHRFHLPARFARESTEEAASAGLIPFKGYEQLLERRFEEAIDTFLAAQAGQGPGDGISSALAAAYHRLAFQTLADQVRRSVREVRGNQWMFRMGHPADHPLRIRPELLRRPAGGAYPILRERTPVRMDLTHCGWSDIFFLGMDYPEGARVLNVSIDLAVHGRDARPEPPVNAWLRVIDEPVLRLTSVDLKATADIVALADVFDFAKDYLGLLKAAVIASGIVPPGVEGSGQSLAELLARIVGEGRGLEIVSSVNDIPKGSRLAVSTNLLGALISVCMRATGQTAACPGADVTGPLSGTLSESDRRLALARALLGEWLGGSGGGWQDSGGIWPGIKLIQGVEAAAGEPESGISRGRLMPRHEVLGRDQVPEEARRALQESLVLVHGGMAQNVGPILEMVTEKYLLRSAAEWQARGTTLNILDEVLTGLKLGDIQRLGTATSRNFAQPIQTIIPWATNLYTETLIRRTREAFAGDFWGFWMLGGMSGGGMGFIFAPQRRDEARQKLAAIMSRAKRELEHALPFAMDPVVFDYAINEHGTQADLLCGQEARMPGSYEAVIRPKHQARPPVDTEAAEAPLPALLAEHGFDPVLHEQIRAELLAGKIGLAKNRLPGGSQIEDVPSALVRHDSSHQERGLAALRKGELAVVTLAAGAGSRWTQGAGVCKALHPFCKLGGRHRTFVETHLAKSRRQSQLAGTPLPHVFTTSYLTHTPLAEFLQRVENYGYEGPVQLSPGRSVGQRLIPTERDLRFLWEEMPQQVLDQQQQKVRDSLRTALRQWARDAGEASDYTDNAPLQCLHPVGHFYEVPNLLRNGVLARLLRERPQLRHLLLHNIDTCGVDADPALLGQHIASGACLTFEVIPRRLEDRGGGLARVNGRPRIVEGLAMPREEEEFKLTYYNTMTTWIDVDQWLAVLGLTRAEVLAESPKITPAIRALADRLPTYITLKEVKKRWGHGQEDVFPVAQFEKLWSDLTALSEIDCRYVAVPRSRGQQLKDQAQLDGWLRDGSAAHVERLCQWE